VKKKFFSDLGIYNLFKNRLNLLFMKQIIWLVISLFFTQAFAQNSSMGLIEPGENHVNLNAYNEYFLPQKTVIKFLDMQTKLEFDSIRIEKYKSLTANYIERINLSDSTNALLKIENQIWHSKLNNNDLLLEETKKTNIQLMDDKQRIRRSRIYYFFAGVVSTTIVYIALK